MMCSELTKKIRIHSVIILTRLKSSLELNRNEFLFLYH